MAEQSLKLLVVNIIKNALGTTRKKLCLVAVFMIFTLFIGSFNLIASPKKEANRHKQVEQSIVSERSLNRVKLNDDSIRKLGIQLATIKRQAIKTYHIYGGDIVIPAGGLVAVSAPISGKIVSTGKATKLRAGMPVESGQLLYRIQPIITADARANLVNALADAESAVNVAKSQFEATTIALNRANKLLQDLVGSQRNVDEANATHEIALRNLEAANVKRNALHQVVNLGTVESIDIKAPQAGMLSNILAVDGQLVSAGNPILEISTLNTMWVRVPIPTSDLIRIDQQADASLQVASTNHDSPSLIAKPVNAPPTADPLTSSTHLYYAIPNNHASLRPMQRVTVVIQTSGKSTHALALPWSAVVFDIYGGSWVYIQKSNHVFERKRVFLDHVDGKQAIISEGPAEGAKVVVNGALELFGVETGFSH